MRLTRSFLMVSFFAAVALLTAGCGTRGGKSGASLPDARRGFTSHLLKQAKTPDAVPQPPAGFELVHYSAPPGSFPAYVATASGKGKHPAIVWIVGGFDNSIGDTPWAPASPDNDQSARAFPQAGIVTMYPSLRGGNNNPGYIEVLYGEVDDIIAAGKYLASRPDVDPKRIYLGGHSTGGTLALLTAESTKQFRAVFAFGPVSQVAEYGGGGDLPFDTNNKKENELRSPIFYLGSITTPTFVFEGTEQPSNLEAVQELFAGNKNDLVHFYQLPGVSHFSELAPVTPAIASRILADTGKDPHFSFLSQNPVIKPIDR